MRQTCQAPKELKWVVAQKSVEGLVLVRDDQAYQGRIALFLAETGLEKLDFEEDSMALSWREDWLSLTPNRPK